MRKLKGQTPNNFRVDDLFGYIELTDKNGLSIGEVKVDKFNLSRIIQAGRWYLHRRKDCTTNHVFGSLWSGGVRREILLHRFLLGDYPNLCIDHINGNGLDNTLSNLCVVTNQQNSEKRFGSDRDSQSGIRGIRWEESRKKWLVRYKKDGKTFNIGRFSQLEDAIQKNNLVRREVFPYNYGDVPIINIMSILNETNVNGPGNRICIWTQGCTKGCKGCFNPESWSNKITNQWTPQALAQHVLSQECDGITISGGDPLEQPEALLEFLRALHLDGDGESLRAEFLPKGIICFTGYLKEELAGAAAECLEYIDLLIDGRYMEQLRYTSGLAGSSNQRFHFSSLPGRGESRLQRAEILIDQAVEVHVDDIDPSIVRITGFPSIDRTFLKRHGLRIESDE